ncbi:hypothetical protein BURK1_02771 [Burkholderiales bacterium]|nr:hypothetical protein BURK1_02771 [Burkholderiales bacterium]
MRPRLPPIATLAIALAVAALPALAQEAKGALVANGKTATLTHAIAIEVDSTTEPGFLDVVVVLSDRKLSAAQARDVATLEAMTRRDGLAALRVVLNPDAKPMSAEPLHPAFTTFVSSALWVRFAPSAYDEKRVAGRLYTPGPQSEFGQRWSYDATFVAPIVLDPAAKTVPRK